MTQPAAMPEAPPDTSWVLFEDISHGDPDDQRSPAALGRLRGFLADRGPGACLGYLLLALLALAFLVAEVWGTWIMCDMLGHAAWHQWREWHHG